MQVYVTDDFDEFMHKVGLSDRELFRAAQEVANGLFDANLGGVLKKRIASKGISRRDANRTIIAFRQGERMFFIAGWRKSDIPKQGKEIPDSLLESYRLFGSSMLVATPEQIAIDIQRGLLREVSND
ncbi:type II toxin-antitoxin system RelE/ParE family toxin [Aeromonas aquatica]|uniref:type II toxin-antitoxin system RelE/ParE family toxin n=1 Tax=Aeromonas aquatica TaxID=558964 RepID=UPI00286F2625|nr:type II toxin-antitoxin system RelE/ParE family toxin [Aeromonas aquatica]